MSAEVRKRPEFVFRDLSPDDREHIMRHIRALISNGFCRSGLIKWGVDKLEAQLIIMFDLGFLRIGEAGNVQIYHISKCKYVAVAVQLGARRPRRNHATV